MQGKGQGLRVLFPRTCVHLSHVKAEMPLLRLGCTLAGTLGKQHSTGYQGSTAFLLRNAAVSFRGRF